MKAVFSFILALIISPIFSQENIKQHPKKILEDTLFFKLDISFNSQEKYAISHIEDLPNEDQLIKDGFLLSKAEIAQRRYYASQQVLLTDSLYAYIVDYFPLMQASEINPYGGIEFKRFLYLYNPEKGKVLDKQLIALRSLWVEPINSGDKIHEQWMDSKLYKQENELFLVKTVKETHTHSAIPLELTSKPKVKEISCYQLKENTFQKIE